MALFVPLALLEVVFTIPWLYLLIHGAPIWQLVSPILFYWLLAVAVLFAYQIPGIAVLNRVTPLRMLAGTLLWGTPLVATLAVIVIAMRRLSH